MKVSTQPPKSMGVITPKNEERVRGTHGSNLAIYQSSDPVGIGRYLEDHPS